MFTLYTVLYSPKFISQIFPTIFHVENCFQISWHLSQSEAQHVLPLKMDTLANTIQWERDAMRLTRDRHKRIAASMSLLMRTALKASHCAVRKTFIESVGLSTESHISHQISWEWRAFQMTSVPQSLSFSWSLCFWLKLQTSWMEYDRFSHRTTYVQPTVLEDGIYKLNKMFLN